MKRIATVLAVALAAAGAGAAQTKVGIVNLQRAVAETDEIRKTIADGAARYRPREEEIAKLQADLQNLQQQIGSGKLSPAAEQQARAEGRFKERQLQRKDQDLRDDVARERDDIIGHARQRMQQVVQTIAEERGLDLVIDSSSTVSFKTGLDITEAATAAYNRANPVKP
ncbi:MAG: OmpH family outer membrane protein [Bryobacteraceae bacterium]|jgi:outer membrane protein